ncbi:MAG: YhbY family RNA-binding protein [Bacillales bacterium]|nr:YhbY family RNA-binding protein [Bacillales bacterium]
MLSKKQIKYLRGLANPLDAKYQIGKRELSKEQIDMLDKALIKHELIKISVNRSVVSLKEEIAGELSECLHAELIQIIGSVIVLFRKNLKESNYHLPQ